MAAVALTPRVRIMAICDGVRESATESGVFNLKGVRQRLSTQVFPFSPQRLWLFLLLSSPRRGEFPAYVRVVPETGDKAIYFAKLEPPPRFEDGEECWAGRVAIRCSFPQEDRYFVQLWFFQTDESDVLKAEMPFLVGEEGN